MQALGKWLTSDVKWNTKADAGLLRTSSGVPTCSMRPLHMRGGTALVNVPGDAKLTSRSSIQCCGCEQHAAKAPVKHSGGPAQGHHLSLHTDRGLSRIHMQTLTLKQTC